jgi:hypothetical protein
MFMDLGGMLLIVLSIPFKCHIQKIENLYCHIPNKYSFQSIYVSHLMSESTIYIDGKESQSIINSQYS